MTTTSGVNGTNGSSAATASALGSASNAMQLGADTFLKLMLTQLKNQDPMSPQDPTAFLGQLAQLSTVQGIQSMQSDISSLTSALRSSQVLDGTTLVGHTVLAANDTARLAEAGGISGQVTVPKNASTVQLLITDASGQAVRTLPMSAAEGAGTFNWDGTTLLGTRAPAGTYTLKAVANIGGVSQQLETQVNSRVNSVTIDPKNSSLTLNTDTGPVALSNVRSVT
jgi:flagellar basal-body rod modification protein FlgD